MTLPAGQAGAASIRVDTAGLADGSYDSQLTVSDVDGVDPVHPTSGAGQFSIVVDGAAPTAPTGLGGSVARKNKVNLNWNASFDAISGVSAYTIYRNGVSIGQTGSTSYTDSGTSSGATYSYAVIATDGVGNASPGSAPFSITVTSTKGGGGGKSGGGGGKGRKK